jgi:hypothetical protein
LCAECGLGFRLWSRGFGQLHAREVSRALDGIIVATATARLWKRLLGSSNPSSFWAGRAGRRRRCCCVPRFWCAERLHAREVVGKGVSLAPAKRSVQQAWVRNLCVQCGLGFHLWSLGSGHFHAREVSRPSLASSWPPLGNTAERVFGWHYPARLLCGVCRTPKTLLLRAMVLVC